MSCRVAGIDGIWGLQFAVFRHLGGIRLPFFSARAQLPPRNIILGRPSIITALADPGFLANGLTHHIHPSDGGDGRHNGTIGNLPISSFGQIADAGCFLKSWCGCFVKIVSYMNASVASLPAPLRYAA